MTRKTEQTVRVVLAVVFLLRERILLFIRQPVR
jgi:hypothetical protein